MGLLARPIDEDDDGWDPDGGCIKRQAAWQMIPIEFVSRSQPTNPGGATDGKDEHERTHCGLTRSRLPMVQSSASRFAPAKKQIHAATGNWDRDLDVDLQAILDWGAKAVVTLMEDHERHRFKSPKDQR